MVWPGKSGKSYRYFVYNIGANFKAVPGNYIFTNTSSGKLSAIYIGQVKDLSEDFENHPKMPCVRKNGANQIHVRVNDQREDIRQAEVEDIISAQNPPCNKEEKPVDEKKPPSHTVVRPVEEQNMPSSEK